MIDTLAVILMLCVITFFVVDYWLGASGSVHLRPLERREAELREEIRALEAKRDALQSKIDRLSGPEVDPELLDERLRRATGDVGPRDVIIQD
ncbi:MAG: septum formation initiator family protein [Neomegalonema sp.]|nr:septum formation initiator family protein [Neomegalonema sp.]